MPPSDAMALESFQPAAAAAARNRASRPGSVKVNVTFIQDRACGGDRVFVQSRCIDGSIQHRGLGLIALAHRPSRRLRAFSHLNTNAAMYQAKVGGVFNIDCLSAIGLVIEHMRRVGPRAADQILAHDDEQSSLKARCFSARPHRSGRISPHRWAATECWMTCPPPAAHRRYPVRSRTRRR